MDTEFQIQLFKKSLSSQLMLREVSKLLGRTAGLTCLDLGIDNGAVSQGLRAQGGTWHTLTRSEENREGVAGIVKDNVQVFDGRRIPFEDKTFDVIVVSDYLERIANDEEVIAECHRVTKATGSIVVDARHEKSISLIRLIGQAMGYPSPLSGIDHAGYSEFELFALLKDGFDVHEVKSYMGPFMKLVDLITHFRAYGSAEAPNEGRLLDLYSRAHPFNWLAFQILDLPFLLFKGYRLVSLAKRHAWHNRTPPVIRDGRTLQGAVLDTL